MMIQWVKHKAIFQIAFLFSEDEFL